jgi:Flp pilus assembly protein TadD
MPFGADDWSSNQSIMKAAEKSGNLEVALSAGARELEARPDNKEARLLLAKIQTRAGLLDQALLTLEPLAEDTSPEVGIEVSRVKLAQGEVDEAAELLSGILNQGITPEEKRTARKLMAISEDQTGKHAAAQAIYKELLVELDEPSVRHNYGQSLLASKNYDQAAAVLKPLVDLPQFSKSRVVAAAAMARSNKKQQARDLMEGYMPEAEINRLLQVKQ